MEDFDPNRDRPLAGWLMTGVLVLVGVTFGGLAASFFIPRQSTTLAAGSSQGVSQAASVPSGVESTVTHKKDVSSPPQPVRQVKAQPRRLPKSEPAKQAKPVDPPPKSDAPLRVAVAPTPGPNPVGVEPPQPKVQPEKPRPENADRRDAFGRAVNQTRQAMALRDLAAARRHLKTVEQNVQNQQDQAQFERLQIMLDNLTEFWAAVNGAISRLQPTEEIDMGDNRAAVVAVDRNLLVLHIYGKNQEYRMDSLPLPILKAIVNQSFLPTPGSNVIVGTFLAIDGQGADRAQARKLWESAAKAGQDLGKQLLPELEAPLPSGGGGGSGKTTTPRRR